MRETDWTKVLGWPGYRVYRHEINETTKTLKLWVRRKRGNRKLVCSGCGRKLGEVYDTYEREVRDLPCFEFRTTVVIELYRVRCPDCGVKTEKVPQLPSKARPIAFHLDAFFQSTQFAAGSREGIWWLPRESVTDYLILTNAGDHRLDSRVVLYDASGKASNQRISLATRETKRLSVRSLLRQAGLTGSYGGFKIEMAKGAPVVWIPLICSSMSWQVSRPS